MSRSLAVSTSLYGDFAVRSVSRFTTLESSDETRVRQIAAQSSSFAFRSEICGSEKPTDSARLLLSGWACRLRILPDGRRQIFDILIPGDFVGLNTVTPPFVTTIALTPVATTPSVFFGHDDGPENSEICLARPSDCRDRVMAWQEVFLLGQIVRIGRQTAYERLAHLLLELFYRCQSAGLSAGPTFPMPLTQEMLADALGLSYVHMNRVLQQLRRAHLIDMREGACSILDMDRLTAIADFTPPKLFA